MNNNLVEYPVPKDLSNLNTLKENELAGLDGFIKFILAAALAVIPFLLENQISLGILSIYLLIATLILRIRFKTLMLSAASYCVIVLFPFLFGIGLNWLIYSMTGNQLFAFSQSSYDIFLRMFRLFIIWYVSILYFHTTPLKTVIGLLDKLLAPLKLIGVPVQDYLKVVMCIIIQLKGSGAEIKKNFLENARSTVGATKRKFRINFKGITQVIVSLLVNSFEKLDKIQDFVEKTDCDELYNYQFRVTLKDAAAVGSIVFLTYVIYVIEKGYWL